MKKTGFTSYLLIAVSVLLFIPTLISSWNYTVTYGGTDLRCRTIGSRLLTEGKDPYFYKWNPADGEYLLDPNDPPERLVNGVVTTPAMLWMLAPLSALNYPVIRIAWFFIQYLSLAAIFFFLLKGLNRKLTPISIAIILLGLVCTNTWLMHVERGQIYIINALLLTFIWWLYQQGTHKTMFFSGFAAGLFILIRPFALVIGTGMLLTRNKRWIAGAATGLLTGLLLFVAPKPSAWKQYFTAMKEYQNIELHQPATIANAPTPSIPATIEGASNLKSYTDFPTFILSSFYVYAKKLHIPYTSTSSTALYGFVFLAASALFLLRNRQQPASATSIFLFAWLLYWLAECLVISPRGAYNMIQWIFPLFLIIRSRQSQKPVIFGIIIGLLLVQGTLIYHPRLCAAGELILACILFYATFTKEPNASLWEKPSSTTPLQS